MNQFMRPIFLRCDMNIIEQSATLFYPKDLGEESLKLLERIGRVCWKSEDRITENSYKDFLNLLLTKNHLSVLEHISATFHIITDRGVSHELVRHRLASYTQSSTRYVIQDTFILPIELVELNNTDTYKNWENACQESLFYYNKLLSVNRQFARSVLPNSLATELYMTANLREWLHVLELRTSLSAHPQMRDLMNRVKNILHEKLPLLF